MSRAKKPGTKHPGGIGKRKGKSPLQLFFIDRDLLKVYREEFSEEVSVQQELSMLVNQYMFDRITSKRSKNAN